MRLNIFCSRFHEPSSSFQLITDDEVFNLFSQHHPFTYAQIASYLREIGEISTKGGTPLLPYDITITGDDKVTQHDYLYQTRHLPT